MAPSLLTYDAISGSLSWRDAVEALRQGHRCARPELGDLLMGPEPTTLLNRAAYVPGLGFAVKAETVVPTNAARGLPSVQGNVLLFDEETGSVRAVIESRLVTAYKTAGDSVLGALLLARPVSRHLVIAGAGTVAANLARAYSALLPALEQISIWARRPEQGRTLAASLADLPTKPVAVADLESAVREADIVATATMAREPILFGHWIRPGTHVDLIGAFTPDMREADDDLMAAARIYVDCRETTIDRIGDLMHPICSGAITRDHVLGDLYDLVALTDPARQAEQEITVFKNGGGAHLDLMIARYIASAVAGNAES